MANGIMVDEATYYGDSEKYTGASGSSTNQWCVEDCYDFLAMDASGNSVCYKLVNDIDFNQHPTYRYGFNNVKSINKGTYDYLYLDGDGHFIYNLILKNYPSGSGTYWIGVSSITNTNFANMILLNCQGSVELISASLTNCNFGITMSASNMQQLFYVYAKTDCTFNIKGTTTTGIYLSRNSITRCHINVDISTPSVYIIKGDAASYRFNLESSYITGVVRSTYSQNPVLMSCGYLSNSYIALDIDTNQNEIKIDSMNYSLTFNSPCFIDTELMPKLTTANGVGNLYYLTTAQAQDADYLMSLGFVSIPVTST